MATRIAVANTNWTTSTTWAPATTITNADQLATTPAAEALTTTTATPSAPAGVQVFTGNGDSVDGILVFFQSKPGADGNISVILRRVDVGTDEATVTIAVSDLPTYASWVFFKFGAPVTLTNPRTYCVQLKRSTTNGTLFFYRDGTVSNWNRSVRRNTTGAVAAGERVFIAAEWTAAGTKTDRSVSMNETSAATDYGKIDIGQSGKLSFTTGATSLIKTSGVLDVWSGGTLEMGTTGTPVGSAFTATLQFDCTTDGEFGLVVRDGGTYVGQGASKTFYKSKLAANLAAAGTAVTTADSTLWKNGDAVAIAATTRPAAALSGAIESEYRLLSADASGTSLTLATGVTYNHNGSASNPAVAEIVNLTRNVVIAVTTGGTYTSNTLSATVGTVTYLNFKSAATVDLDWIEARNLGANSIGKRGVEIETNGPGDCNINGCAFHAVKHFGLYISNPPTDVGDITITNTILFNAATVGSPGCLVNQTTASNIAITGCVFMMRRGDQNANNVQLSDLNSTFTGNTIVGGYYGLRFSEITTTPNALSDITIHNSLYAGVLFASGVSRLTLTNFTIWRCGDGTQGAGILYGLGSPSTGTAGAGFAQHTWSTPVIFGCFNGIQADAPYICSAIVFNSASVHGSASAGGGDAACACANGLNVSGAGKTDWEFNSSSFGTTVTGKQANTVDITIGFSTYFTCLLKNTRLANAAPNDVAGFLNLVPGSFIRGQAILTGGSGTNQRHRSWFPGGKIQLDTANFHTATPGQQLMPSGGSIKLESGRKKMAVDQGGTLAPRVWVLKNAYSGAEPRLILKANAAMGVSNDTVLATYSGGNDVWRQMTASATPSAIDDGVYEFVVDCAGSGGSVFIDDWSAA